METLKTFRSGVFLASAVETQAAGAALARLLPPDAVVTLKGLLGAGKTTFVQGMARAWEIAAAVTSPTYQLYHVHQGRRQLVHLDAYRLQSPDQAEELLIEELLQTPWCLVIEWPERLPEAWLQDAWQLRLEPEADGRRLTLT
ncbi:MAG: tRNA (adenosine(37)-N6)-threonylcarbamoyltransferase complex ATPase subunit type 1 TsaE, partial [Opitutales bacterium]